MEFTLQQAETVTIGCRGIASAQHNWMSFSAFRLVQFPGDVPTGITGTERGRNNTVNQIYDLQGRKLSTISPCSGKRAELESPLSTSEVLKRLPKGVYIVLLKSAQGMAQKKYIKR